jgi:predicted GNAT family acetyltransferase
VDGVIEVHACSRPEWRGRWLTREVVDQINQAIAAIGPHAMIVQVKTPYIGRVLRRLGFTIHGAVATLQIKE